ncbi:MAG: hypothetical protein O3A46_17540 [Candidatus Poribacteria bacterium]|nr:hypothetical protein [Candidatus Poribacteria bacterium]
MSDEAAASRTNDATARRKGNMPADGVTAMKEAGWDAVGIGVWVQHSTYVSRRRTHAQARRESSATRQCAPPRRASTRVEGLDG